MLGFHAGKETPRGFTIHSGDLLLSNVPSKQIPGRQDIRNYRASHPADLFYTVYLGVSKIEEASESPFQRER